MEDGKVGLKELSKVIDYMATLTDKDLLARALEAPAKKFEKMRARWVRLIEALNDAGALDLMLKVFDEATKAMEALTKEVKANPEFFEELGDVVSGVYKVVKFLVIYLYKLSDFLSESNVPVWLQLSLVVVWKLVRGFLALTAVQRLAALQTAVMYARFALIAVALAFIVELIETMQGKDSFLGDMAKDSGFWGVIASQILLVGESVLLFWNTLLGVYHLITTGDWGYLAESFERFQKRFEELFPLLGGLAKTIRESIVGAFGDAFTWVGEKLTDFVIGTVGRFVVLGKAIRNAMKGDFSMDLQKELSAIPVYNSSSSKAASTPFVPPKYSTVNGVPSMLSPNTTNQTNHVTINVPQGFTLPMAQELVTKAFNAQIGQGLVNYPLAK